jgi:hypothetical protein
MPRWPVVLIVGCTRSGTTLFLQWLASTTRFAYPSNLLSRFYGAPYVGAKIQRLLTDPKFDFRQEFFDLESRISFESNLGKTRGALEPNEFWYFWRRFLPDRETHYLDERSLAEVDAVKLVAELAAIEDALGKPLALKGNIIRYNVPYVSSILDRVLFVYVKRHPFYTAQSLLKARVKYYGDQGTWYGLKPEEYSWLKDLDPFEQVAGHVYFTNHAIETGLGSIDAARGLAVSYEQFCTMPERVFGQLVGKFAEQGCRVDWDYTGPDQFRSTNQVRLSAEECKRIIDAYKGFSGIEVVL